MFSEISQNSQENTCTRVSFLLKKRLWHRCFPVKFEKFLRTPILKNIYERLLLENYILTYYNPYIPDILFFKNVSLFWHKYEHFIAKNVLFLLFFGHTRIPGLWTQELDAGLWTLDSGLWTLDAGCWTLDAGLWTLITGRWF